MKPKGVEFLEEELLKGEQLNSVVEHAKFIEKENMLDFGLFVKREGWALKTGKNIDDLYNDFFNQK
jgi:hypothetical protein